METAKEDEDVGGLYLSQKNWRAAQSRFESAVVLDPENPDVYWGLAEAQRHLEAGDGLGLVQALEELDVPALPLGDSRHAVVGDVRSEWSPDSSSRSSCSRWR